MIKRAIWCDSSEQGLNLALGDDMNAIKREVKKGLSSLWAFDEGWIVTRAEGEELVIVALQNCRIDLAVPLLLSQAKKQGFSSVRCHTKRKSLVRYLEKYGVSKREYVLEVSLNGR
jgi:hypothetical protein